MTRVKDHVQGGCIIVFHCCVCVCVCVCRLFEVNKQLKAVSTLEGGKQLFHHYAHVFNRGVHLYWNNHVPTIQTCTETIKCKHTPHKHTNTQRQLSVNTHHTNTRIISSCLWSHHRHQECRFSSKTTPTSSVLQTTFNCL